MLTQLKKHLTLHELWEDAKFFFLLNLGLVATAVGIAVFKTPNHFAFGGTSGLSIVLATLFPAVECRRVHVVHQRGARRAGVRLSGRQVHGVDRSTRRSRCVFLRQPV